MMIFNSFAVDNDYNLVRNDRTAVGFPCRQIKILRHLFSSCREISSKGVVNSFCI